MNGSMKPASGVALAFMLAALLGSGAAAQDSLEIRADGPDVSNSAAGADNVRMERNPGRQQATSGDGQGNQEVRRAPRDSQRQRNRSERRNRNNNGGGETAPVEGYGEGWAPGPEADAVPAGGSETKPVQLPSTGVGIDPSLPAAVVASIAAAAAAVGIRRRR